MSFSFKATSGVLALVFLSRSQSPTGPASANDFSSPLCLWYAWNVGAQEGLGWTWGPRWAPFPLFWPEPLSSPDGLQCPPHPQKVFKQSCDPQPCSSSPDEQTSWKNVVSAYPQCPSASSRRKGARRGPGEWKRVTLDVESL